MLLIDTSAWVDYLRGLDTAAAREVRQLLANRVPELATTGPIIMELLAGAPDEAVLRQLETLTNGLVLLPVDRHRDFHDAATLHRAARRHGRTVRKLIDCLIAAVAIRNGATLVHKDTDFEVLRSVSLLATRHV